MRVIIELGSVPTEIPGRRWVVYHSWSESVQTDEAADRLMDVNHARQIVERICKPGSPVLDGRPDEEGYQPLFAVYVDVSNTHRRVSSYRVDYARRAEHVPMKVSQEGMCIKAAVDRAIREGREKEIRRRKVKAGAA